MQDKEAILRIAGAKEGLHFIGAKHEGDAVIALFGFILKPAQNENEKSEEVTVCITLDDFCADTLRKQLILKTFEKLTRISY